MAEKLVTQILLLCLFNIFVAENAALHRCSKSKIACLCGERPNEEVKQIQIEFFYAESKDCSQLPSEVCASHSCLFYPDKIAFPLFDDYARESHRLLRDRRSAHKCPIPQIEHAAMDCYLWGEFISCDIKCSRRYALEEDGKVMLKTKRMCQLSKSVWSPKNTFPLCKPYINCEAILIKPGELTCHSGLEIPYCDISCKMDIENSNGEVAMERYECVNERFAEILPHCATVKKVDMIKLPEKQQMTLHKTG